MTTHLNEEQPRIFQMLLLCTDLLTLVTRHWVEKMALAKGLDRPLSSAAIRPRPWYR